MTEKATFAAGCFWGVELNFRKLPGVLDARVGYTGGHFDHPTYQDVCAGVTKHAEAIEITFDPDKISYTELLTAFFDMHDPTTLDRQGPDIGSQYRSAIFYHDAAQKQLAEETKESLNKARRFKNPVVTQIAPVTVFWPAEEYHQRYLEKRGSNIACH